MKTDIRKLLPPAEKALARLEHSIEERSAAPKGFSEFYERVKAQTLLQQYRTNAKTPESLADLIFQLCRAQQTTQKKVFALLKVKATLGKQLLNHAIEPYRISSKALAEFARLFEINFCTLKAALSGSYSLFLNRRSGVSEQFARSTQKSQRRPEYSRQLTAAFTELRSKSKVYRESIAGTEEFASYLKEVEQWMS